MESVRENFIYWYFGLAVIAGLITLTGFIFARKFPISERGTVIRKFAAVGLAFVILFLPIFRPHISSYSRIENLDELKTENLDSVEKIAEFEQLQPEISSGLKLSQ